MEDRDLGKLCRKILDVSKNILRVSVITSGGRPLEEVSRGGRNSLDGGDLKEMLLMQCALAMSMGRDFDEPFGKIMFTHMERENVSLLSFPLGGDTVLVESGPSTGSLSLASDVASVIRAVASGPDAKPRASAPLVKAR